MRIRAQFFPDVVIETVSVTVTWSGVGPQELDEAVVARLEPPLRAVEGVEKITSVAREGVAVITLEFQPGWDMSGALNDVEATINEVRDLPDDADDPIARRSRFRDRVTDVIVSGPVPLDVLERQGEALRTRLFSLGVTRSRILGVAAPVVRVDARPESPGAL